MFVACVVVDGGCGCGVGAGLHWFCVYFFIVNTKLGGVVEGVMEDCMRDGVQAWCGIFVMIIMMKTITIFHLLLLLPLPLLQLLFIVMMKQCGSYSA
jgi:hypothetical protein